MTRPDRATTLFRKASQDELVLEKLLADSDVRHLPIVARLRGVLLGHFAPVEVLRIRQFSLDEVTRLRRIHGMNATNGESHHLSSLTFTLSGKAALRQWHLPRTVRRRIARCSVWFGVSDVHHDPRTAPPIALPLMLADGKTRTPAPAPTDSEEGLTLRTHNPCGHSPTCGRVR